MSIQFSRYSKLYSRLPKPDLAQNFPRNVFQREPNYPAHPSEYSSNLYVKQ